MYICCKASYIYTEDGEDPMTCILVSEQNGLVFAGRKWTSWRIIPQNVTSKKLWEAG